MGGAGLPFGLIFIVLAAIAVLVGVFVVVPWLRGESRRTAELTESGRESLVYDVPEGVDPAMIVAALRNDGLEAIEVQRQGRQRVVISCPMGRERLRPRARAVISHEATTPQVTFADE
jgi:hypothetical protein